MTVQHYRNLVYYYYYYYNSLFSKDSAGRYGCLTVLHRSEISYIVNYLATA